MMPSVLSQDTVLSALDERVGWCPTCDDFTTINVLSLEAHRRCDQCMAAGVLGVIKAIRGEFIKVNPDA